MSRRRGFTLVKLPVGVAILAMLVGMLLPTLTRAKDVVCRSNLGNIWTPMRFFAEDHEGFLPPVLDGFHGTWNQLLADYGKDQLGWAPPRACTAKENFNCLSYQFEYTGRGTYGMNGRMAAVIVIATQ